MQGEAGPAVGLISIQLGQCSLWEGDIGPPGPVLTLELRGFPQPMPLPTSFLPATYVSLRSVEHAIYSA